MRSGSDDGSASRDARGVAVAAARIIPALDELEDRHARLGLDTERTPVDELALQRGEKLSAMALSKQSPAEPVSRANQAVAFASISRSSQS